MTRSRQYDANAMTRSRARLLPRELMPTQKGVHVLKIDDDLQPVSIRVLKLFYLPVTLGYILFIINTTKLFEYWTTPMNREPTHNYYN